MSHSLFRQRTENTEYRGYFHIPQTELDLSLERLEESNFIAELGDRLEIPDNERFRLYSHRDLAIAAVKGDIPREVKSVDGKMHLGLEHTGYMFRAYDGKFELRIKDRPLSPNFEWEVHPKHGLLALPKNWSPKMNGPPSYEPGIYARIIYQQRDSLRITEVVDKSLATLSDTLLKMRS